MGVGVTTGAAPRRPDHEKTIKKKAAAQKPARRTRTRSSAQPAAESQAVSSMANLLSPPAEAVAQRHQRLHCPADAAGDQREPGKPSLPPSARPTATPRIVPSLAGQCRGVAFGIDRLLFLADGRCRLEGDAQHDRLAVADASWMPPELLVAVCSRPSSVGRKASLCSLPFSRVPPKPEPISKPFVAGKDITALARSASSLSNTGMPSPMAG